MTLLITIFFKALFVVNSHSLSVAGTWKKILENEEAVTDQKAFCRHQEYTVMA